MSEKEEGMDYGEPWTYTPDGRSWATRATGSRVPWASDWERIVACVNACAGVDDPKPGELLFRLRQESSEWRSLYEGSLKSHASTAEQRDTLIAELRGEVERRRAAWHSICVMLGWGNDPPQRTIEMDISCLKQRALDAVAAEAALAACQAAGREYTAQTDPLIACGPSDDPAAGGCGTCRACALEQVAALSPLRDKLRGLVEEWRETQARYEARSDLPLSQQQAIATGYCAARLAALIEEKED